MNDNVKAAHVTGRYSIVVAIIGGIFLVITTLYSVSVTNKNSDLRQKLDALEAEITNATVISVEDYEKLERENTQLQSEYTRVKGFYEDERSKNQVLYNSIQKKDEEIQELRDKIDSMPEDVNELNKEYTQLQSKYNTLKEKYDKLLRESEDNSSNLSSESVSDMGSPNSNAVDFIRELSPYQSSGYSTPNTMTMMGNTYTNGFELDFLHGGYALFNLDGKYKTLEFDIGHIDGSAMKSISFNIYLDGQYEATIEANPEMRVTHAAVDLKSALTLKIDFNSFAGWRSDTPRYGCANAKIS